MNDDWRRLPDPPKGFEFVSFVNHSRILATVPENRKRKNVLWDTRTGAVSDAQVSSSWTAPEIPLLAGILLTKEGLASAVRELPTMGGHRIFNAAVTRSGLLIVVSGEGAGVRNDDDDPRAQRKFITVFDARSREYLRRQQLFIAEQTTDRTAWLGGSDT